MASQKAWVHLCKMRLCEFLLPKHFRHTIGASRIHVAYYRKQGVLFAINGNRLDLCKLLKILGRRLYLPRYALWLSASPLTLTCYITYSFFEG